MNLSIKRKRLLSLNRELNKYLEELMMRKPLMKGSLYELRSKCGKANCRCTRGELHKAMVLSWSEKGKHRIRTVGMGELYRIRELTKNYQRFRNGRAGVSRIARQIQEIADEIEKELLKMGRKK